MSKKKRKRWHTAVLWVAGSLVSIMALILLLGFFHGRFNFKYRIIEIEYDSLPPALEGFTIAHISDLHLESFTRHQDKLKMVFDSINSYEPDIIVNTGDFVTFLWDELEPFMGILGSLRAEYGVYAIPGNHDTGLYSDEYHGGNYDEHLGIIREMLEKTRHTYLSDTSVFIHLDSTVLSLSGIVTYGMVPNLYYGDTEGALEGTDSSDFNILLTHDPNHWLNEIQYLDDIELTLSGHTHGMQIGIVLPHFQLSPASILYPAWNGLYGKKNNFLYVNRGLGTIGIHARIGMSPEISLIRLRRSEAVE